MAFTIQAGRLLSERTDLTTNSETAVLGAVTSRTIVKLIRCVEYTGATPSLTILITDKDGNDWYLRGTTAMTAYQTVSIEDFVLNAGDTLNVTASNANDVQVFVDYFAADKTAGR